MARARRPENRGLPLRWEFYHGCYYYRVPHGLEDRWDGKRRFRLGKTLSEAHRTWARRIEPMGGNLPLLKNAFDRYELDVVPGKAPATQEANISALRRLRVVFGDMAPEDFEPVHAYGYRDRRGKTAPTAANRELEVLSHVFTKLIEWGRIKQHPMIEGKFRKIHAQPRYRYVEDWELAEALKLKPLRKNGSVRMIQAYLKVKLLTGRRRIELLRLKVTDCGEDGPLFELAKQRQTRQKTLTVEWSQALREAVQEALAARPVDISPWVFCDRRGRPYLQDDGQVKDGWDSIWQRFMDRVLAETAVETRFTEHDLRAKAGSDAESLERARELLAHATAATTQRVYRRRPARVKPLR